MAFLGRGRHARPIATASAIAPALVDPPHPPGVLTTLVLRFTLAGVLQTFRGSLVRQGEWRSAGG